MLPRGRRREDPRRLVARTLTLVRQAITSIQRAEWRLLQTKTADQQLLSNLETLRLLLERIALRLETIAVTGILSEELISLPLELIKLSKSKLLPGLVDISPIIDDLDAALSTIYSDTSSDELAGLTLREEPITPEAERILREVEEEAKKRVAEGLIHGERAGEES
jgi:hypothetical protein